LRPSLAHDPKEQAMAKVFECERDGLVIRGEDDEELLANVQRHVGDAHPDLVGKLSRDDVLAMAKEA
jgi:predicted small metal-binding protein